MNSNTENVSPEPIETLDPIKPCESSFMGISLGLTNSGPDAMSSLQYVSSFSGEQVDITWAHKGPIEFSFTQDTTCCLTIHDKSVLRSRLMVCAIHVMASHTPSGAQLLAMPSRLETRIVGQKKVEHLPYSWLE